MIWRLVPIGVVLLGAAGTACGGGLSDSRDSVGATTLVGHAGGKLDFAEAHLEVPADAIDHDIDVTVRRIFVAPGAVVGDGFAFAPADTVFSKAVTVTLDIPAATDPAIQGRLLLSAPYSDVWRPIMGSSSAANRVAGTVTQLGTFAAVIGCGNNDDCPSKRCDSGACQAAP